MLIPAKVAKIMQLTPLTGLTRHREPFVFIAIPAFAAHLTDVVFKYFATNMTDFAVRWGHLLGPSGIGTAQLTPLLETIMRPFRNHIEMEYMKRTPIIQNRGDGRDGRPP